MDRRWLPLNALRAFEAAGRALSFTAAARQLRVAQSAISRHVIGLEDLLGVALFERRPQSLVLTEAGRKLLASVTQSYDRLDRTIDEIMATRGDRVRTLVLRLPPTFAARLAVPALSAFRALRPDLTLEIDTRPIDQATDRAADVAIVYGEVDSQEGPVTPLWQVRLTLLCHPTLAPAPDVPLGQFLAIHDVLHVRHEGRPRTYLWEMFVRRLGLEGVGLDRGLVFDTAAMAVDYALAGSGLALADPRLFATEIETGRLVCPFDLSVDDGYQYSLKVHPDDRADPDIATLATWLVERFGDPRAASPLADPLERALAIQRRSGT